MTRPANLLLAALLAVALCIIGPWLDGQPSDTDAARATVAALRDTITAARQQQRIDRAEADMQRADARAAPVVCLPHPMHPHEPLACPAGARLAALEARP